MSRIIVTTTIDAPVSEVWRTYTEPEDVVHWSFASDDWECTSSVSDLRVGGRFKNRLSAKDRSAGFDFAGTYTEVILNERLSYRMDDGREATVLFTKDTDDTTTVTVTFEPETENPHELQREGWQAFLDNFKKYVERKHTEDHPLHMV